MVPILNLWPGYKGACFSISWAKVFSKNIRLHLQVVKKLLSHWHNNSNSKRSIAAAFVNYSYMIHVWLSLNGH